jgi:hypothetical protein
MSGSEDGGHLKHLRALLACYKPDKRVAASWTDDALPLHGESRGTERRVDRLISLEQVATLHRLTLHHK